MTVGPINPWNRAREEDLLGTLAELRQDLARSLRSRNSLLDSRTSTELTRRILDRLVVIRILEDRRIEPPPIVPTPGNKPGCSAWRDFQAACRRLDRVYRGIAFRFHETLDSPVALTMDETMFAEVLGVFDRRGCKNLFDDMPLHVFGSIHERFLGNSAGRKASGVYYTPPCVVDFIVRNTVGKLIEGKAPDEIAKLRFADIACGSGAFLLGIYDCLMEYLTRWYRDNPSLMPKAAIVQRDGGCQLSREEKGRILTTNIFGVDIDPEAAEVARLSLYLKMLDGETTATAGPDTPERHLPVLPSLDGNIKCGNSLIGSDFCSGRDTDVKGFDWQQEFGDILRGGGFDAILGNPPYVNTRIVFQEHGVEIKEYFARRYRTARGGFDLYVLFVEKSLELLRAGGMGGMIVPNKIATLDYAAACRALLLENTTIERIADLSGLRLFPAASVYPYVLVWKNQPTPAEHVVRVLHAGSEQDLLSEASAVQVRQHELSAASGFAIHGTLDVESRVPTQTLSQRAKLHSGTTGFAAKRMAETLCEQSSISGGECFEFIVSGNIDRYRVSLGNVRFMNRKFDRPVLPENGPNLTDKKRRLFREPKIVIAGLTRRLEAALDPFGGLALGVSVYAAAEMADDPCYLLGLLNSKLLSFLFRSRFQAKRLGGGFLAINKGQLEKLPIRVPDLELPSDKLRHDQLIALVDQLTSLQAQLCAFESGYSAPVLERQIAATDEKIDDLVYELYGLTEEEIRLVKSDATK